MKHFLIFSVICLVAGCSSKTSLDSFQIKGDTFDKNAIANPFTFNGYTNYWQDVYRQQYRYGNLFRINMPDLEKTIAQSKIDIVEAMGITGLQMQEGFFYGLATSSYTVLNHPSVDELQAALESATDILVFADPTSETGEKLLLKSKRAPSHLNSHQQKAKGYAAVDAFILKSGKKTLYVALGANREQLDHLKDIIDDTERVLKTYELKRGWFGAETLVKSVTCTPGNPLDVIGQGMNEGNSWFVFSGYMDFLAKDEIAGWISEVNIPIVTDVGYSPVFGCDNYAGLQVQQMFERDAWLKFAREKKGYLFRNVYNQQAGGSGSGGSGNRNDDLDFDGYFATVGNAPQINQGDKPFVNRTGPLLNGTINSMILFNKKGEMFDRAKMWEAIMDVRAVAVAENGFIMGPALFRKAMQLLLLDRVYVEEYFGDRVDINAIAEGHQLQVTIRNLYPHAIKGTLKVKLPAQLSLAGNPDLSLQLPANSSKELIFEINPSGEAMGKYHAVVVQYDWDHSSKSTLAGLNLPPAISTHQLLFGASSGLQFPVTIYNYTEETAVNVKLTMTEKDDPNKVVYTDEQTVQVTKGATSTFSFDIKQEPGHYFVKTEAMGVAASTQLGIEGVMGTITLKEVDLNDDGINEYVMENDHVRVTLLAAGARAIEYFVKTRNDNVFFKLWPDLVGYEDRPFTDRSYYLYGGFENFLGQASIETHKVHDVTVLKREGNYVQVKMEAEYFGNTIEKIFTLYANSPLFEIRQACNMINPELNVLGPNPLLALGKEHWLEDKYYLPEIDGLQECVMMPDKYYGRTSFLKEGWNAGYDTKEDVSFVGAFPVKQPYFMHMWMNHPSNYTNSPAFFVELQPWLPLYQNTTTYFSYYMWADAGPWEKGLQALRDRNLITGR